MEVSWSDLKQFVDSRAASIQWIEIGGKYFLSAFEGPFKLSCSVFKRDDRDDDQADFEDNYKARGNRQLSSPVTTQLEKDDKDLKLAKAKADVDPETNIARIVVKVPGDFGTGAGRYVAGGYAVSEVYGKDDYVTVRIEDQDRCIAMAVALALDPSATEPLPDEAIQAAGVLPGVGLAFPNYPEIKSYTDDEMGPENAGWYFWPLAMGNDMPPAGETEVEPIGGHGFLPSGLYLILDYVCAVNSGSIRVNLFWGKKEV